jgi:pimeloyl-ACP methyl ester carboxylesterase
MLGSRTLVNTTVTFDQATIGSDAEAYLFAQEAKVAGIRPGAQKQIVWADPDSKGRTDIAVIYIHGFSASPAETRPFPDVIANSLGANLFFTRLTGHGATSAAMGAFTVNNWVNDFAEAVAIGERLGKRVVVIASSTGASLTTWALAQPAFRGRTVAAVFISPNFKIRHPGAILLTMPGARELAHLIIGANRSFTPVNDLHRAHWTHEYPVEALLPMAETVKLARNAPVELIRTPVYAMISSADQVVSPDASRRIMARWGGLHVVTDVENVGDPNSHVLVGDPLSPLATNAAAKATVAWLRRTLFQSQN